VALTHEWMWAHTPYIDCSSPVIFTSPLLRGCSFLFSLSFSTYTLKDWRVEGDHLLASLACQFYLESLSSCREDEANASNLAKECQCRPKLLYSQLMCSSTSWPSILSQGVCCIQVHLSSIHAKTFLYTFVVDSSQMCTKRLIRDEFGVFEVDFNK
jgi:hypothetical protein